MLKQLALSVALAASIMLSSSAYADPANVPQPDYSKEVKQIVNWYNFDLEVVGRFIEYCDSTHVFGGQITSFTETVDYGCSNPPPQ